MVENNTLILIICFYYIVAVLINTIDKASMHAHKQFLSDFILIYIYFAFWMKTT
jgi:hypothetical protein